MNSDWGLPAMLLDKERTHIQNSELDVQILTKTQLSGHFHEARSLYKIIHVVTGIWMAHRQIKLGEHQSAQILMKTYILLCI